ncbi:MAG: tetratricopeptide repeat protein, partial [Caldimonas sp.]
MRKYAFTLALLLALPGVAGADEADAHYRAGLAFKQQNKTDEAIQEFLEAIKLRHDYAAAEFSLGVTYKMRNQ